MARSLAKNLNRIIDNNYRRMLERDIELLGADEAFDTYKGRVLYCIPLFVAPEHAYNVMERCTPEMEERGFGPGKNIKGQPLNEEGCAQRDCWVVRLTNDLDELQAAVLRSQSS